MQTRSVMQTSDPEAAEPSPAAPEHIGGTDHGGTAEDDDVVARFLTDYVEPLRARQPTVDAARPNPLPKPSRLLAAALAARRITVKKVTEGRWVFRFAGTTIGGYSLTPSGANQHIGGGVTTLVSAHARRVLGDAAKVRTHLALMDIPHPAPLPDTSPEDPTPPLFGPEVLAPDPSGTVLLLRAYVVGREAISVLAMVPDDSGRAVSVEVTDVVTEELRTLAVDAMRAIPGLLCASVTLETPSLDSAADAEVVGIDEAASITPHHFPQVGRGQPVADAIAEQILFTAAL